MRRGDLKPWTARHIRGLPLSRASLMDALSILRAIVGLVLVAWLPGWAWTRALVPDLDALQRALFSVGLSVALITLALYLGNVVLGIRVEVATAVAWSVGLTLAGLAAGAWRRSRSSPRSAGPHPPAPDGGGSGASPPRRG